MTTAGNQAGIVLEFELNDRMMKSRSHAGFTQASIARQLGISQRSVSNYESGERKPSRAIVIAWSFATGVNLHWLETGEAPSPDGDGASDVRPKGFEPLTS
ncbi:MAG: helix-turn-helix transcriptional regulator [Gordonia sp. (in: high G+C Gram-positive bacteria)]|uniref:helix-turn-helix domain-containing protein n=1 Tax=Gordonia sp. (in: high G+C Gram-positive bacteria) TaxID=84139 RepID=UPI003C74C915